MTDFEREDMELQGIMGDRFKDLTQTPAAEETKKATDKTNPTEKAERKPLDEAVPAIWSPFNAEPSFTQKLMNCAKWGSLYGGLYMLFYYWQCTGQMQPSASGKAMAVCAVMVGWSFGKYAVRGNR